MRLSIAQLPLLAITYLPSHSVPLVGHDNLPASGTWLGLPWLVSLLLPLLAFLPLGLGWLLACLLLSGFSLDAPIPDADVRGLTTLTSAALVAVIAPVSAWTTLIRRSLVHLFLSDGEEDEDD